MRFQAAVSWLPRGGVSPMMTWTQREVFKPHHRPGERPGFPSNDRRRRRCENPRARIATADAFRVATKQGATRGVAAMAGVAELCRPPPRQSLVQRPVFSSKDRRRRRYENESRVGTAPIKVPDGVVYSLDVTNTLRVEGPMGVLQLTLPTFLQLTKDRQRDGFETVLLKKIQSTRRAHELHGLTSTVISNMMQGVSEGHTFSLKLIGVGYKAELIDAATFAKVERPVMGFAQRDRRNRNSLSQESVVAKGQASQPALKLSIGVCHPLYIRVPLGIAASLDKTGTEITLSGADRAHVSLFACNVRKLRRPDPYKGKGIRYADETVLLRKGKKNV